MTSFAEVMTGHPDEVQVVVDVDLIATTRGPAALDRALADRDPDLIAACYRALLARTATEPALRAVTARERARAVTARQEHDALRGGTR